MRFYSYRWRQAGERFRGGRVGTAHVQCYVNANFTPSSRLCFLGFDFAELPVFLASGLYAWLTLAICGLCTRWTVAVVRHSYGLLTLRPDEIVTLQKGEPQKGAPIALVGAGTNQTAPLFLSPSIPAHSIAIEREQRARLAGCVHLIPGSDLNCCIACQARAWESASSRSQVTASQHAGRRRVATPSGSLVAFKLTKIPPSARMHD